MTNAKTTSVFPSALRILAAAYGVFLSATAAQAAPSLTAIPNSVAREYTGTVELHAMTLVGATAVFRLYVDADGDGVLDPEDYPIWADVVADNAARWSPNMFNDVHALAGHYMIYVRAFMPKYPYIAGSYIWEVEDTFDGSKGRTPFTVTQSGTQSVSGTVLNASTMTPIPGAIVTLAPACDVGEEAYREYSAVSGPTGAFTIQVPAALDCHHRLLLAFKPGYLSAFAGQPFLIFNGASVFTGRDAALAPGQHSVTGRVLYETGPQTGGGIPGVPVFADSNSGAIVFSVAFTDQNGNYTLTLADGDWFVEAPDSEELWTKGALRRGWDAGANVTVSGAPTSAADILLPASNATISGTLTDNAGNPIAGRWMQAFEQWPCDLPDCRQAAALTNASGNFTLGVEGPAAPSTRGYGVSVTDVLEGLVAVQRTCDVVSAGSNITGANVSHLAPASFVTGRITDKNGAPLGNICLQAWVGGMACVNYAASTVTDCNGDYALPAADGTWNVEIRGDDEVNALYRDLDETPVQRQVTVSGGNVPGVDFIIGRWLDSPTLTNIEQNGKPVGSHVRLDGHGFSFGSMPLVYFGATPASIVAFRPDRGHIFAEIPGALAPGDYSVTVYNTDLGKASNALCYTVISGSYTPACSVSGTLYEPNGTTPAPNGLVLVYEPGGGAFLRAAVSDAAGNWSVGLPASATYPFEFVAPAGQPWTRGMSLSSIACPFSGFAFAFGNSYAVTGQVVQGGGNWNTIRNARVELDGGGYFTHALTDDNGYFTLYTPQASFSATVTVNGSAGSRFVNNYVNALAVSGNVNLGQIMLNPGSYFCGRVVNKNALGQYAEVRAYRQSDGSLMGRADTDPCTGRFDLAMPLNTQCRLEMSPLFMSVTGPTHVQYVNLVADSASEFDFRVFDQAALQFTGLEVRAGHEYDNYIKTGQPFHVFGENLAGGSFFDVFFSDGLGGYVAGTGTVADPARGILVTRVPAGAATGEVFIRKDGTQDSAPVPFTLLSGTFNAGTYTVSGKVTDSTLNPVAGAFVILFLRDPLLCDGDISFHDYALTDAAGNYSLTHPGGDLELAFLAPPATTLASGASGLPGVFSSIVHDKTLNNGYSLHIRVVDDALPANPVPNAQFEVNSNAGFDFRATDSNGEATLFVEAGDFDLEIRSPMRSRLVWQESLLTVSGPVDLGDVQLQRGAFLGGRGAKQNGTPVSGTETEAWSNAAPYDTFFRTTTGFDGAYHGPVPFSAAASLQVSGPTDGLANYRANVSSGANDFILYPSHTLLPAGFIAGFIRDAAAANPIAGIGVHNHEYQGGMPGNSTDWADSCSNGYYRLKLPVGWHYLHINAGTPNNPSYMEEWYQDAFCSNAAVAVSVNEGMTTAADINLDPSGSVSGVITGDSQLLAGIQVCASGPALGVCSVCAWTDTNGNYSLSLPAGTDYRIEANGWQYGYGYQCYNGYDGCWAFTPVSVTVGMNTPNVDFIYGCSSVNTVLFENAETGSPGWTASGLWHLNAAPMCSPSSYSGSWSWHYARSDGSCNYDTGAANTGALMSPVMTNMAANAVLSYWFRRQTDNNCAASDRSFVYIWVNGVGPYQITEECDNSNQWMRRRFDLSGFYLVGDSIQIGFVFDTLDANANNYLGWMIDDAWVFNCLSQPCAPLAAPSLLSVQGQNCGGSITVNTASPTLVWSDVANESQYQWEIYDGPNCTGAFVAGGTTFPDTTSPTPAPTLPDGTYSWRVRAGGDGIAYCTSIWTCGCPFTVDTGGGGGAPPEVSGAAPAANGTLSWIDLANEDNYEVFGAGVGTLPNITDNVLGAGDCLARLGANVTSFSTPAIPPGGTWFYLVRGVNAAGNGALGTGDGGSARYPTATACP